MYFNEWKWKLIKQKAYYYDLQEDRYVKIPSFINLIFTAKYFYLYILKIQ